MPQQASQSSSTPPLPPGYALDAPAASSSVPPLPPGYSLDSASSQQPSGIGMEGAPLTDRTVPNARIRNMTVDPTKGVKSGGQAFYEGAKTGLELGSIPATIGQPVGSVVRGAIGAALGGVGAKTAAKVAGAGDFGQEVAGDAGSVVGGGLTEGLANTRVGRTAGRFAEGTLEEIPGVRQLGKLRQYWDAEGPKPVYPGAPEPAAPPQEVTQAASLYRGSSSPPDPAAGLGQIPVRGSIAGSMADSMKPQTSAPLKRGSISQMMNDIQSGVEKGTGASPPPNPKAPIYQRGGISSAMQEGAQDMPQGHTPHQSSALRSSMYDPSANEFHARMTSGDTTYVYGDVSPDEAKAFTDAGSKGSAYQQIKGNHPLVAKIVNGKRVAVKASQ